MITCMLLLTAKEENKWVLNPVHHTSSKGLKFCKGVSPSDVESRSHSNETPTEIMLGLKSVSFSFETEKMCGQSFCRWMEEEKEVQDVILLRWEGGSKVKLVETDVQEQCALVQLMLHPAWK